MAKRRNSKLPQETFEATIYALSHDGRGIACVNGKKVFIFGALLNESVGFTYTRQRGRYDEGCVVSVKESASSRVVPVCQHYGICGGCSLQHMAPSEQILHKQWVLLENLKHIGKVIPEFCAPPLVGLTTGYRHKARLGVRYVEKKQELLIGFRERKCNKLAIINQCQTLHPSIGQHITQLRQCIGGLTGYDSIPQIEVAIGHNQKAIIVRHVNPLSEKDIIALTEFCKNHDLALYLQSGNRESVIKVFPNDNILLNYRLENENIEFTFHPAVFTQVNPSMNDKMVSQAMQWLMPTSDETVLDLFCGLGNFTLPLAKRAKAVLGVEGDPNLVSLAQQNALANNLLNVSFVAENLEDNWQDKPWAKQQYDKIILDPSRAGAQSLCQNIQQFGAKKILYVSCHPATLARDANYLVHQHNYQCKVAGVIDMFPHTQHVEAMVLFER